MPRPLRSSCDRCHSQKLKCPKQSGSATCVRCLKAGAVCVFSQARQPGPAAQRTPAGVAPVYEGDIAYQPPSKERSHLPLGWPLFGLGDVFTNTPEGSYGVHQDQPTEAATPETPRATCVRQLTTLAAEVDRISLDLSIASTLHTPKDHTAQEAHALFSHQISHFYPRCLEQLFVASQRLIDMYQDVIHQLFGQPDATKIFCAPDDPREKVDVFLFNLVATCHSKVVDVVQIILANSKRRAKLALTSPDTHEPQINLPELRVGNFVVSSTSSMQALLLVHILSRLLDQTRQLRKGVEKDSLESDRSDKASRMLLVQCELLEEKTQSQMNQLNRVRDGFAELGFIK